MTQEKLGSKTLYEICNEMAKKGYRQITLGYGTNWVENLGQNSLTNLDSILIFSDITNDKLVETYESVIIKPKSHFFLPSSPFNVVKEEQDYGTKNLIFEGKYTTEQFNKHKKKFNILELEKRDLETIVSASEHTIPLHLIKLDCGLCTFRDLLKLYISDIVNSFINASRKI